MGLVQYGNIEFDNCKLFFLLYYIYIYIYNIIILNNNYLLIIIYIKKGYFKGGEGFDEYQCSFFQATSNQSKIKIMNSTFEDNNMILYKPFFSISESYLK